MSHTLSLSVAFAAASPAAAFGDTTALRVYVTVPGAYRSCLIPWSNSGRVGSLSGSAAVPTKTTVPGSGKVSLLTNPSAAFSGCASGYV